MSTLVFECLSEEIPASIQREEEVKLRKLLEKLLAEHRVGYTNLITHISLYRTMFCIYDIQFSAEKTYIRGARTNANHEAIQGFANRHGVTIDELIIKTTEKGEFYFYEKDNDTPVKIIQELLQKFTWSKSMRWGKNQPNKWIRPIVNILCLLDDKILNIEFAGTQSNNKFYVHPHNEPQICKNANDYISKVSTHFTNGLSRDVRMEVLKKKLGIILLDNKELSLDQDETMINNLLELAVGMYDQPELLLGSIDEKYYSSLPKELIISVMVNHQKYFPVYEKNQLSKFIAIVNNKFKNSELVKKGHERVMKARLEDALFLVENDKRYSMDDYYQKLEKISCFRNMGTMLDKTNRLISLVEYINPNEPLLKIAAKYSKVDLATEVIKEFPELQGVIGEYYYMKSNEVGRAIRDHYFPKNSSDKLPVGEVAVTLAIADKIDNIVSLMMAGAEVTGSSDQFGLRRNKLCLRKLTNNDLSDIIDRAIELAKPHCEDKDVDTIKLKTDIMDFLNR